MADAAGYVLVLSQGRARVLDDYLDYGEFAEPVPEFQHSRTAALVCFVCREPNVITHVARGHRGLRAGTDMRRLNLVDLTTLARPVIADQILSHIPPRFRARVAGCLATGGPLKAKTFSVVSAALRSINPQLATLLNRYSAEIRSQLLALPNSTLRALAFQKDAVIAALRLAGIDVTGLHDWVMNSSVSSGSFLDGLPQARLREDQMLVHDLHSLPGFESILTTPHNAARFQQDLVTLTVILANRLPLEHQLGVDLIYYNETYNSFTMVQYKAMEEDSGGRPIFRLPNVQLEREIARMERTLEELRDAPRKSECEDYRLNPNPFFLKLSPRIVFQPDDVRLIPGMYFPLEYWRMLEQDPAILQERGGRAVTLQNAGRHLTPLEFISVVSGAWVGTSRAQSAILEELIRSTIESGKAVVVAVKSQADPDPT